MSWTARVATPVFAATAALLLLSACDNGPSAVDKQAAGTQMATRSAPSDTPPERGVDHRNDPVKAVDGKPMWSASRKFSAEDNAQRSFERNGEAFGAANLDQFVRKAHAFVESPPAGVLTLKRANGDTLFYDPRGNIFAVANKAGAPRTMFKPDDGMAYWEKQKARESSRRTASAKRSGDDDA